MRSIAILALALVAAAPFVPRARPGPNALTKEEARAGWLLLFDGETTFGWRIDGRAKVEDGELILGGEKEAKAEVTTWLASYELRFEALWEGKQAPRYRIARFDETFGRAENTRFSAKQFSIGGAGQPRDAVARFTVPAGSKLRLRGVKVKPEALTPLFNGKDLTGWKVFKGDAKREKSRFTVTKEGWLNVKDGPGDLQCEKTFDDFVLQLECISNGKHLNSGLFFRAIPGEYWMGYEAQIRNEFTAKPAQKYTVEVFDPKTNKLTEKKEVMSPAIDYGTGAVYRRVPARKAASKDGEWFTLTVVARGRHIATWVNGVQQVDWTDNRPADKNPRKGYREEAGAFSIQGHDRTTDLSFRNLRVGELKRPRQ